MGYKVYISGPMSGKDYKNRFAMAAVALEQGGNVAINPAKVVRPRMTHAQYSERTQDLLDSCDTILMLDGWQHFAECNAEIARAVNNKMIITFEGGRGCQSPDRPEHEISHKKPAKRFTQGIKGVFSARKATTSRRR